MTSILLLREYIRGFYARYSFFVRPMIRFVFAFCVFECLNLNIGYMEKLGEPLVLLPMSLFCALLPYGMILFVAGLVMIAHVYVVSLEMALITAAMVLIVGVIYFGLKPGDGFFIALTPLAFFLHVPYVIPLLAGLGGSLASVLPVSLGVFCYHLLLYVKQNAGVLTGEASVDLVQRYVQILRSVLFDQSMFVLIATFAAGVVVVYLFRRLSMDYSWAVAIVAGSVAELLVIFIGDFVFNVSVEPIGLLAGMAVSALLGAVYAFLLRPVDYSRTEYVQFEDDDYYYYVKAVPKMTVSTPQVRVQKISSSSGRRQER